MAKINVQKDFTVIDDGEYTGIINKAILCNTGKVMLKIALENGTFFVSFHNEDKFGDYPFNRLFMAVDSDELTDIEGLHIRFTIQNNKSNKSDMVFCNIRKITVID